jgi:hypothetical protein
LPRFAPVSLNSFRADGAIPLNLRRRRALYPLLMPYSITQFQPTPNPNALKCILNQRLPDPPRSFRSADEAGTDPLAGALFAVSGVTSLLINGDWMTINKRPEADWPSVKKGVQSALGRL